jgi:hypothetical protein
MNLEQETPDMLKTLREGCWIGEDGNAVCIAQNKREALRTIKALMRRDCGEAEARSIKSDEISVGWARLATQKEKEETWSEFFVMYKEESPYKCYVLRV